MPAASPEIVVRGGTVYDGSGAAPRRRLAPGYAADVVVLDPARVQDHATYERPHQYATGVHHVLVNGTLVIRDGEHTGATPGQVVRGPGWRA